MAFWTPSSSQTSLIYLLRFYYLFIFHLHVCTYMLFCSFVYPNQVVALRYCNLRRVADKSNVKNLCAYVWLTMHL